MSDTTGGYEAVRNPQAEPVLIVHPADVSLPEIKAQAAVLGVSVTPSFLVPRGQAFIYDPKGGRRGA